MRFDHSPTNLAGEQLAALPGSDRAAARAVIENMDLPDDRRARLLEMLMR